MNNRPMNDVERTISELLKQGQHRQAAELCAEAGQTLRAAELFALVWAWPSAMAQAEKGGHLAKAYEYAIAGRDRAAGQRVFAALMERPDQAVAAAQWAIRHGRDADAARLAEAAQDWKHAAALFERAGELFSAARCYEQTKNFRQAARLYEQALRHHPESGLAALRLGMILASSGRYAEAIVALQTAERTLEIPAEAQEWLVVSFLKLGLDGPARVARSRLQKLRPDVPAETEEFLNQFAKNSHEGALRARVVASADSPDTRLLAGRYRVEKILGAGATGRVFLAHDEFQGRPVAVKVLHVGTGPSGREAYLRFAREARASMEIVHPNLVRVFEFNSEAPFLVMEYLPGGTLEDRLAAAERAGRPLTMPTIRYATSAILDGLHAVHRVGITHRDLKPANILFGAAGEAKLGDFGAAHLQDLASTLTGTMLGTLAYMAPEQILGSTAPSAATDLYAFGIVLYRMLTGHLPFTGPDLFSQHLNEEPTPISQYVPHRGSFEGLVRSLLQKDPGHRPASAEAVRRLLEQIADPDEDVDDAVALPESTASAPDSREASQASDRAESRYTKLSPFDSGWVARDTLLGRLVELRPYREDDAAVAKTWAQTCSTNEQAVYDIDADAGLIVLEYATPETNRIRFSEEQK